MIVVLAALALLQQGQPQQQALPGPKPSPVTRIALSPAPLVVAASDSIQLSAVAYDANGRRVDNAKEELAHVGEFKYAIINKDFNTAKRELSEIIRKERSEPHGPHHR